MIFMKRLPWWCVWRWTPLCLLRSWSQETSDWGIKTCSLSMKIIVRWQGAMMSTWLSWNIWRIWGQLREKRWDFIFIVWERGWGLPLCWQIFCWQCKKLHLNKASPDAAASSDRKNIFHFQFFLKSQRLIQSCSACLCHNTKEAGTY